MAQPVTVELVTSLNRSAVAGSLCADTLRWQRHSGTDLLTAYALWRSLVARRAWLGPIDLSWVEEYAAVSVDTQVKLGLIAEYGRLLPVLDGAVFALREMRTSDLVRPTTDHRPVEHADWEPSMPAALVIGRRVLDGYHRVGAAASRSIGTVSVVVAL